MTEICVQMTLSSDSIMFPWGKVKNDESQLHLELTSEGS